jgi:hypothetical protein
VKTLWNWFSVLRFFSIHSGHTECWSPHSLLSNGGAPLGAKQPEREAGHPGPARGVRLRVRSAVSPLT